MTVGIPGTGIGGLFYLGAALLLPLRKLLSPAAGMLSYRTAFRQAAMGTAVFGGMWATGWIVGMLISPRILAQGSFMAKMAAGNENNILQWAMLSLGYLTLGVLLLIVEISRLLLRKRRPGRRPSGEHGRPAAAIR